MLLAIPFGVAIGLSLGLVGGGGSILAVPVLVYVLGEDVKAATTASLVIVGVASIAGGIDHARDGRVRWKTALGLGVAGVPGAVAGTALNRAVGSEALLLAFALLLLIAAYATLREGPVEKDCDQRPGSGRLWRKVLPIGLGIGLLTGFFGVGGGFLVVPALVLLLSIPLAAAVGTSLFTIALLSAAAFVAHLGTGTVDWLVTGLFTASAVAGVVAGSRFSGRIPDRVLTQGLAALAVTVAIYLIAENVASVA